MPFKSKKKMKFMFFEDPLYAKSFYKPLKISKL